MKLTRSVTNPWRPVANGSILLTLALLWTSCATPKLEVKSVPVDVIIHMDGSPTGETPLSLEPAYYGRVLIHGEREVGEEDLAVERTAFFGASSQLVDFQAPVTPWLFGLDLLGETLVRIFGTMDEKVQLDLPLVEPKSGQAFETLIEESEASSLAR